MTQTMRTFVAVETSPAIRQRAAELIEKLRAVPADVRWVQPHNLHLTLKFLGDVKVDEIPRVCQSVQRAAAEASPFQFEMRGAGAFPRAERPRTIWLGAGQGEEEMAELSRRIESALQKLGFPREGRRFQAHLTIGRVRRAGPELAELGRMLRGLEDVDVGQMTVEEVVVFCSHLAPSGPTYEPLGRGPLAGK